MEALSTYLRNGNATAPLSERPDLMKMARLRVDSMNATAGVLDQGDGYTCDLCKNKGMIYYIKDPDRGGIPQEWSRPCKCMAARTAIRRMKRSGLGNVIKEKTFDKFQAVEPWQTAIKEAAQAYARAPAGWFYLGGQPGSGKSHLGAAICRHLLLAGRTVVYMSWLEDAAALKARKNEEGYGEMIDRYKTAEILYIDDLFKTSSDQGGAKIPPSGADIRLAFEIVNYRYNNPALLTIVSSEYYSAQLLDIDEAVGSRIVELAGANSFDIARDRGRNYRLRGGTVL